MLASFLSIALFTAAPLEAGDYTRTLQMGQQKRTYHIHIPKSYDPKKPTLLVIALHGAAMNGKMMRSFCDLDKKADTAGFIVVYPDGTGAAGFFTWNAGGFRNNQMGSKADDVAFIGKLIDDLSSVATIDAKRVYATGLSNGGMMSYRLAAELSDRIAAIAPVAGTVAIPKSEPKRPVPVIHFHGTADTFVPFNGPIEGKNPSMMTFKGAEESVTLWAKLNGCDVNPKEEVVAKAEKDQMKITRKSWLNGKMAARRSCTSLRVAATHGPERRCLVRFLARPQ